MEIWKNLWKLEKFMKVRKTLRKFGTQKLVLSKPHQNSVFCKISFVHGTLFFVL